MSADVLLADIHDGEPISPDHGGPVRVVVPRLYAWKSAKWIKGIEFSPEDKPGYLGTRRLSQLRRPVDGESILRVIKSGYPVTMNSTELNASIIDSARIAFEANKNWADQAVVQLDDEALHVALDPNTNCIAVIMKHVAGNLLSRWTDFLTSDGEKPWRDRDDEFVDTFTSRQEITDYWEKGWNCLWSALADLSPDDLATTIKIRGERHGVPLGNSSFSGSLRIPRRPDHLNRAHSGGGQLADDYDSPGTIAGAQSPSLGAWRLQVLGHSEPAKPGDSQPDVTADALGACRENANRTALFGA